MLERGTGGTLWADVCERRRGGRSEVDLDIHAPDLDGFQYTIATAAYGACIYPATLQAAAGKSWDCADEQSFEANLGELLTSAATQRLLSALISEAREKRKDTCSGWCRSRLFRFFSRGR